MPVGRVVGSDEVGQMVRSGSEHLGRRVLWLYQACLSETEVESIEPLWGSNSEPFGLAPLEAAAAGLPVVVTKNGGPSESLRDGATSKDPHEIAAGLRQALGAEWDTFAMAGRQLVLDRYTWERTADGYVDAIERARVAPARSLLPIHPYFLDPGRGMALEELTDLYLS